MRNVITKTLVAAAGALLTALPAQHPGANQYEVDQPTGIVDCLLPGTIRRVGNSIYQMPGRPIRTIASECRIRGGDYLLFDRANYETSLSHWIRQAENDDADAMLYVGEIYEKGLGREPDYAAAAQWYQRAADAGNTTAMISLAHLYKTGQGVKLDLERAQALYSQAFGTDILIPLDPTSVPGADQRIETLIAEVDEVRRQKIAIELELRAANQQLATARTSLTNVLAGESGDTGRLQELQQTIARQEQEIADYRSEVAAMRAQRDELSALRQQLEEKSLETEQLRARLGLAEQDVATARSKLADQQNALEKREAEFRALLANMRTEQDRETLQQTSERLDSQRARIAELEMALHDAEEQQALFQALADDSATTEQRVATLTGRISMLEKQAAGRENDFRTLEQALSDTRASLERQVAASAAAEEASEAEIAERNAEIERLRNIVARAEQEAERHESEIDRLAELSAELEQLRANLEVEQAQSNRLQKLLVESQDEFADTSRRLEHVSTEKDRLEAEIAGLEKQLSAGDRSAEATLEQRQAELAAARDEIGDLRAQIDDAEQEFEQYRRQVQDTAMRQRQAIGDLRLAVAQSRAEREQLEQKLSAANAQFESAKADLAEQHERYARLQDELREARAVSSASRDELRNKEQRLEAEQQLVSDLRAEVERLTAQSDRYAAQINELESIAQSKKVDFSGPNIVMLEPDEASLVASKALTRSTQSRGISVVAAVSAVETKIIRGRVDAPAGLAQLTIDGWEVPFDEHNAFSQTLKLGAQSKFIRVEAVDHNGKRDIKEFEFRVQGAPAAATVHNKQARFDIARNNALDHLKYYALLIGNEDYVNDDFAPDLETPIDDVEAIGKVLRERYGFDVKVVTNAGKDTLEAEFEKIFFHAPSDDDHSNDYDGILIYYAGHGFLSDSRTDNAYYWAPVDAVENSPRTWYETRDIEDWMKNSPTKQIMVVADSCFAGKVLSRDGEGMLPVDENAVMFNRMLPEYTQRKRSRFVLTSGGNAPVLDGGGGEHSVFARAFLDVLGDNESILSAHSIFERLAGKVNFLAERQNFEQWPEFGHLRSAGHESGVFYLPAPLFPGDLAASN